MPRTRRCTPAIAAGRLGKAEQFFDAAVTVRDLADDEADVADAVVTLLVHAGIAAADALCCQALGEHAQGDNHNEAIGLVVRIRPDGADLARALGILLGAKTRAGYGHEPLDRDSRLRCERAAEKLVRAARDRSVS
jgi:hypothetical protein